MSVENIRGRYDKPRISACIEELNKLTDKRAKKKGAIAKLYLENFKSYNDSFGYNFGGLLIDEITSFLESVDGVDVYHIRGVEYIIIIEESSQQVIKETLNTIMQRFEHTWKIGDFSCVCSVNAGVVYFPGYAETANDILEQLSQTISESVQLGQNHLVEYNEKLMKKLFRQSAIAQKIPKAVTDGAIEIYFQPTYQSSNKRFTRIDSGMRMYCEGLGLVGESEFYPVAEQSGQIYTISQFAISKACDLISELLRQNKDFETVAVRVSTIQLLQEHFFSDVVETITKAGIPPNRLAFEVNETTLYSAFSQVHVCMNKLSEMGIEMILSGLGIGSLGIHQILSMSIDAVKATRPLIWQMENTPNGAFVAEGLIGICKNIGLKLIAEGVETEEQASMLNSFGCEYQKGSYYSGIYTAEDLVPLIHNRD